tara:strand:- start:1244 stop:1501 length:258 start_codon:yes stop_codon:yes gene_type:complete
MLRTPLLSSTTFTSPRSLKVSRNIKKRVLATNGDTENLLKIQIDIERMKGRWVHSEGRQEKAYIKIILDLEKKRDALINIKENKL